MSTARAGFSEQTGIDASRGEVAKGEGERAHDPQAVGEIDDGAAPSPRRTRRVASKREISIRSFGGSPSSG
jgi:hypothetical protein